MEGVATERRKERIAGCGRRAGGADAKITLESRRPSGSESVEAFDDCAVSRGHEPQFHRENLFLHRSDRIERPFIRLTSRDHGEKNLPFLVTESIANCQHLRAATAARYRRGRAETLSRGVSFSQRTDHRARFGYRTFNDYRRRRENVGTAASRATRIFAVVRCDSDTGWNTG